MVSPSAEASAPGSVAALLSAGAPHDAQNRALPVMGLPQEVQNMERAVYHLPTAARESCGACRA
jgi:hypothetical protein